MKHARAKAQHACSPTNMHIPPHPHAWVCVAAAPEAAELEAARLGHV